MFWNSFVSLCCYSVIIKMIEGLCGPECYGWNTFFLPNILSQHTEYVLMITNYSIYTFGDMQPFLRRWKFTIDWQLWVPLPLLLLVSQVKLFHCGPQTPHEQWKNAQLIDFYTLRWCHYIVALSIFVDFWSHQCQFYVGLFCKNQTYASIYFVLV